MVQFSHPYMTMALTRWTFVGKVISLLFNMLSRLVITFLPRNKLLISWLQSPSAVILEPPKIKSLTISIVSPSICHEVMGSDVMIFVFWILSFKPAFSLSSFTSPGKNIGVGNHSLLQEIFLWLWLSESLRPFLYSSSVYYCHLLLISSASVRSLLLLSFIMPPCMECSRDSSNFPEKISSLSHSVVFLYLFAFGRSCFPPNPTPWWQKVKRN